MCIDNAIGTAPHVNIAHSPQKQIRRVSLLLQVLTWREGTANRRKPNELIFAARDKSARIDVRERNEGN